MKTKRGFTILEILTVIAIISALTLIAFPVYRQIAPKLILDSTIRDVASDLRYAQQLAVAEQVVYRVSFNIPQNNYSIINSASGQTLKSQTINSRILIQQINGLTDNTVNFNATGGVTESGFIVLLNETNNTSTIEIKPSGYVKIK
ncbi:MAG: prepilin-type N-terminal cleavage/methylation domain-containing protein [Patescibacteria group bacterium]